MPARILLADPCAKPGCSRLAAAAAAAAAVGDPAALLRPPAQVYLEPAIKPAGMLLLLLGAVAVLLLLLLPEVPAFGDPANTGRRMCARNVDPVGDCGPPGAPVLPPPWPALLLLLPPTLLRAPGRGELMLPLLVAETARAAGRVRLLKPAAADVTATAVRTDMLVLAGLLLLVLLLLGPPLPKRLSYAALLAADQADVPLAVLPTAALPVPPRDTPDVLLLLPRLYPVPIDPTMLLPAGLLVLALVLLTPPAPLAPARPTVVLLLLLLLASAKASIGLRRPLRSALTAAHSAVNLQQQGML